MTAFPGEIYQPSRRWAERGYSNVSYFHEVDRGGHFAAWEEPLLFASELRAAFKDDRAGLDLHLAGKVPQREPFNAFGVDHLESRRISAQVAP